MTMHPRHCKSIDICCSLIATRVDMNLLWPKLRDYEIFTENNLTLANWSISLNELATKECIIRSVKSVETQHAYYKLLMSLRDCSYYDEADYLEGFITLTPDTAQSSEVLDLSNEIDENDNEVQQKDSENGAGGKLIVRVKCAKQFRDVCLSEQDLPRYRMRSSPRGNVLLITLIGYGKSNKRKGAEVDDKNLAQLFKQMGFKVFQCPTDLSAKEIKEQIEKFSKRRLLANADSCFVIISGHGDQCPVNGGIVLGCDYYGQTKKKRKHAVVSVPEILQFFTSENCPQLKGKPKVFIFQTCRGPLEQCPPNLQHGDKNSKDGYCNRHITGHGAAQQPRKYDDMLVAHATLRGHQCYRNKANGSWFIQILCEVFMEHAWYYPIHDLLSMVDKRVREKYKEISQTPSFEYTGFSDYLYINPGLTEERLENPPS